MGLMDKQCAEACLLLCFWMTFKNPSDRVVWQRYIYIYIYKQKTRCFIIVLPIFCTPDVVKQSHSRSRRSRITLILTR